MKIILLFLTLSLLSCNSDSLGTYEKADYFIIKDISIDEDGICRYTISNYYINNSGKLKEWITTIPFVDSPNKFNVGDTVRFTHSPERSYQLQIINGGDRDSTNDSVQLWDNYRMVGTFKLNDDVISTLILKDNR